MPTLRLRTLGVSYAIEGLVQSGLDAADLLDDLEHLHHEAISPVGVPTEAVLVDHSVIPFDALQDWLESWVRAHGFGYASWGRDASLNGASATLHFHR